MKRGILIVGRYVYNSLNLLIRRIKNNMATIQISGAMALIPISIGLLLWILDHPNINNPLLSAGIIFLLVVCWGGRFVLWGRAINNARKEDATNNKSREDLSTAIQELRETLKQIKKDDTTPTKSQ
jgi:hypothetical protein